MASARETIDLTGKICDFNLPFSLVIHEVFRKYLLLYSHCVLASSSSHLHPALTDSDFDDDDDDEVLAIALGRTSPLSHFDDEISDESNDSGGDGGQGSVSHTTEA